MSGRFMGSPSCDDVIADLDHYTEGREATGYERQHEW
jgi:hypothetical protein